ncbi:hypothetical protein PC128_g20469 [Phytophthora cactorum]|nr:hypothetical protein PC128_g20469 [Phytophthora cactorum]
MDFGFGLPRDAQGRTGIFVFVDRFSKMVYLALAAQSPQSSPQRFSLTLFIGTTVFRPRSYLTEIHDLLPLPEPSS